MTSPQTESQPHAEFINLDEYNYAGEGANGTSYHHKLDPTIMVKLNLPQQPITFAIRELETARKVNALGLPTPEPGTLITDGKRYGVRFRRILNKKSFSRAMGDNPQEVAHYAREFAQMCKLLHTTPVPTNQFENVKSIYKQDLEENPFFTEEEKMKIAAFIDATPDKITALHGDLQFSNVVTDGLHNYFIDLGDFAYGNPLFDLGMVLLTCKYDSPEFLAEVFHITEETAHQFWEYFVPAYFGSGADPDEMERLLRPYAGLKTLIIERNSGEPFPQFRILLNEILQ